MSQKALGQACGFSERDADVRISQYESGSRTPKRDVIERMAKALNVSPKALNVPDIKSDEELLFLLFALEDLYGFRICRSGSYLYLILNDAHYPSPTLIDTLHTWSSYAKLLRDRKISKEEYDHWRYSFTSKTPSQPPHALGSLKTK